MNIVILMTRKEVIEYLKSCGQRELLSIIQEVSKEDRYENQEGTEERVGKQFLLASTTYDISNEQIVGKPIFWFIARPQDGENWLSEAVEFGTYPRCKTEVRGFCTHSLCPVCDHYVALT